jgi:hypothetical protein
MNSVQSKQEYILCAAVLAKEQYCTPIEDRISFKNPSKQDMYGKYDDIYICFIGRRHCDIFDRCYDMVERNPYSQGFYTSHGRFVSREEAYKIALGAGQIKEKETSFVGILFSEDLY